MATGLTYSVALDGVVGRLVTVEADVHNGVPAWALSGLPDTVVSQARDRCRSAMVNSEQTWPDRRVTVALYPADLRKGGSHYDLAIALALLVADRQIPGDRVATSAVFGELALDGRLRAVPGVLPAVVAALDAGIDQVIVPALNVAEARLVDGVDVLGVHSLAECIAVLSGREPPDQPAPAVVGEAGPSVGASSAPPDAGDLLDVRGQAAARWCVEVAAAGGHHLFLHGPPGAGKTMLAERLPGLLPDLGMVESLEVSQVHSVAGMLSRADPLIVRPPFLAPHHNDTVASVVGGGSRSIRPGAISLAHRGVLFMDEAPEFRPAVHDALRQPLESGEISIRRADSAARFPSRFQLVLAANPCPCSSVGRDRGCQCRPDKLRRYQARISGPVRDRIDITHRVSTVTRAELRQALSQHEGSAAVRERVLEARDRQAYRYAGLTARTNAEVPTIEFQCRCALPADGADLVESEIGSGFLSQRGAGRVVRLAWTLADLAGLDQPTPEEVTQALSLRQDSVDGVVRCERRSAS